MHTFEQSSWKNWQKTETEGSVTTARCCDRDCIKLPHQHCSAIGKSWIDTAIRLSMQTNPGTVSRKKNKDPFVYR